MAGILSHRFFLMRNFILGFFLPSSSLPLSFSAVAETLLALPSGGRDVAGHRTESHCSIPWK